MRVFYSDQFVLPLPAGHRFPMTKYSMLPDRVAVSGPCETGELLVPETVTDEEILRAHKPVYLERIVCGTVSPKETRRVGFPWSEALGQRCRRTCGGTLGACRVAFEEGFAANRAGGTHHAFAHRGEGYCIRNGSAIAPRVLQAEGLLGRVLIVDTDVHQGNGTASILATDPSIFNLSIHGAGNFPFHKDFHKERSDLDVELPDKTDEGEFLMALENGLERAFEASNPQLVIYLAGADPLEDDRLGRLSVSKKDLAERDRIVLESCRERGIPAALTMAGGYAREIKHTVDIHFSSILTAAKLHRQE